MVAEVAGGLVSGSLALLADAGHMLTDFAALAMAWTAFRVARRPADARRTYGFDRISVMAAFVNGLALFAVAVWIVIEAARRLANPAPVEGGIMLAVAALGLVVNIVAFRVLAGGDRDEPQPPRRPPPRRRRPPRLRRRHRRRPRHPPDRLDPDRPDPLGPRLAPHPALGLDGGARQRPHPARGLAPRASTPPPSAPTSPPPCPRSPPSATCTPGRSPRTAPWSRSRPWSRPPPTPTPRAGEIKARLAEAFGFDHATVEICVDDPANARLPAPGCASI